MRQDEQKFTLVDLDGGGAVELFDHALQEVLDNIQDPNTDPKKARKVVLEVTIKPDKQRRAGSLTYRVKAHPAPVADQEVSIFLGLLDGRGYASEATPPGQSTLEEFIDQAKAGDEDDGIRAVK